MRSKQWVFWGEDKMLLMPIGKRIGINGGRAVGQNTPNLEFRESNGTDVLSFYYSLLGPFTRMGMDRKDTYIINGQKSISSTPSYLVFLRYLTSRITPVSSSQPPMNNNRL